MRIKQKDKLQLIDLQVLGTESTPVSSNLLIVGFLSMVRLLISFGLTNGSPCTPGGDTATSLGGVRVALEWI